MVHRVKTNPEAAGLPDLGHLPAVPDAGDTGEVLVGEDGVVVGEQRRALPLREGGREQRACAVRAAVEAEADAGRPRVVGVLDELLQRGCALRVVGKHGGRAANGVATRRAAPRAAVAGVTVVEQKR